GIWNGVFVIDDASALIGKYTEGDEVEVWGTVTETFEDDYWQWSANTYVVLDSMKSTGTGTAVETEVTVADLAGDPEAYEGVLVHIADQVTVASINQYDLTITDGTNNYLLDDDCVPDSVFYIEYNSYAVIGGKDTVRASDLITGISGVSIFSYGTHKIEIMKLADFEEFVAVENHEPILPNNYALYQNYPNPFNPSTNIAFDLPNLSDVTIVVYNIRGQMVKVLTKDQFNAGHHVVRWNGMNRYGKRISTGVYIYRIMANNFVDVKKMVYLK
ncbi:MAG: T9SS type A sorting domain-containing protein, partial [Candidatus Marinimicrobia bacterium]|nr:T9SS type A sorting domain-containing protein [Candidatus Neomarinimicrobiota bacterium]